MVQEAHLQPAGPLRRPVRRAGYLLGVGLAGLANAILLQQILGVHRFVMLDAALPAGEAVVALASWTLVVGAIVVLWRARHRLAAPRSGTVLLASVLMGAGGFGLVEGLLLHHVFDTHRVAPGQGAWDLAWLLVSLALFLMGWRLLVHARPARRGIERPARTRVS